MSDGPPQIHIRWFHAGTSHLLSTAPITLGSSVTWEPLSEEESNLCEKAWQALSEEDRAATLNNEIVDNDDAARDRPEDDGSDDEDGLVGIPVATDQLFEVDVKRMKLLPVFWQLKGPEIQVLRSVWLYDDHHPVERKLSHLIEEAYQSVKPWKSFYQDEWRTAVELGVEGQEKLRNQLEGVDYSVVFEDGGSACIFPANLTSRLTSAFTTMRAPKTKSTGTSFYSGGILVYRGYDAAVASKKAEQASRETPAEKESIIDDNSPKKSSAETPHAAGPGETGSDVTDLILVVHGIGQGLTAQYEGFNFVYATNLFRSIAQKQSASPALASIMQNKRVQFLPIQWRSSLKQDATTQPEKEVEGLDNRFNLDDITLKNTIPFVRDLTNNVLLDIPLFMSHHRERMIESVCKQANRAYRLWCARNPNFEKDGRVHIIAHSLGCALVCNILSDQPTIQPPLSTWKVEDIKNCRNSFLFNTGALFLVGSPVGVFMHLNQGKGRTINSPSDEALDRVGLFGCLAVDSIYNIFNPADPIAYRLNPCVDAERAKSLPPSAIPNVTESLITNISSHVTRMFEGISIPFTSSGTATPTSKSPSGTRTSIDGEIELGSATQDTSTGSRAERRFYALNPHGTLDFYLPNEGNISEYVDMITAHSSYWSDSAHAAFVLSEICAEKEDLLRTGLGPEVSSSMTRPQRSSLTSRLQAAAVMALPKA